MSSPLGFNLHTTQPIASSNTDCTILDPKLQTCQTSNTFMLYSVFWVYKNAIITFNILQDFCSSSAHILIPPLQQIQIATHTCNRTNALYISLECFEMTQDNVLKFRILKLICFRGLFFFHLRVKHRTVMNGFI